MQIGISGRSLVHFFILELLLVGLLAVIGQVPPWIWFAASALLYGALWAYDHRVMLLARWYRLSPKRTAIVSLSGAAVTAALAVVVTWMLVAGKREVTLPALQKPVTLDQSLLTIVSATTVRTHEPLIVAIGIANAGKLLTTKMNVSVDHSIVDKAITPEELNQRFKDFLTSPQAWILHEAITAIPGSGPNFMHFHSPLITSGVLGEVKAGKKAVYIFLVAEYQDSTTPPGKRMVTELALRTSPFSSHLHPLSEWSVIRYRAHLSD